MLRTLLETYLRECGWVDSVWADGYRRWSKRDRGNGLTFTAAVVDQAGMDEPDGKCYGWEAEGRGFAVRVGKDYFPPVAAHGVTE